MPSATGFCGSTRNLLGYERDFTILDREDARHLMTACLGEAEIDPKKTRFPKAEVLGEIFSLAVNTRKSIREVLEEQFEHFEQLHEQVADLEKRYRARKRATNAMDFDDLISLWLKLLKDHVRRCASITSGAFSSCWWTNTRTPTDCRAT